MAIEEALTMPEAVGSSDKSHWQKQVDEKLKSIEATDNWTKTALLQGKTAMSCKMLFKR